MLMRDNLMITAQCSPWFILNTSSLFQAEQQLLGKKKTKEVVAHIELMRDNLTMTAQRVLELGARLDCKHAQENIDDGVHAFCYKGLFIIDDDDRVS